ncbi:hypothetical protein MM817_02828 [Acidibacillus sp. S0AB]|uniref:Uncharacterized protein n=1 Tax=Sulfoacidibacillus ferrooxidans TaxID=2005001 RepID=A0A9X1VA74_9BACL|nr:hypothetical protein [Sulfoacidibacillus ferrooxidans]
MQCEDPLEIGQFPLKDDVMVEKTSTFSRVEISNRNTYGVLLMNSVQEFIIDFNPGLKVNFDGGDLSTYARLSLYKECDQIIGLSACVLHRDHSNSDVVVLQKVYHHIAGYHTDDYAVANSMLIKIVGIPGFLRCSL